MAVSPLKPDGDYASTYETYTSSLFKGIRKRIKVKHRKADDLNDHSPQLRLNWSEEEHEKFVLQLGYLQTRRKMEQSRRIHWYAHSASMPWAP